MSNNIEPQTALRNRLEEISEQISESFERLDAARDKGISLHRKVIKHCSLGIRALHRVEFEEAGRLLSEAQALLIQAQESLKDFPSVYYGGFLQDAEKEYAEARLTEALISGSPLPTPSQVGVDFAPYLNGLGEAVGEMRRYVLDRIRAGDLEKSERLLESMDDIYCTLVSIDFPDAITRGLRRSTDLARGCLERTRGDLTNHFDRQRIESALEFLTQQMTKT